MGGVDLLIPVDVMGELNALAANPSTKRGRNAKLALKYAKGLKKVSFEAKGSVDEKLKAIAKSEKYAVATIDSFLIKELRRTGIPVVTLRRGLVRIENDGNSQRLRR